MLDVMKATGMNYYNLKEIQPIKELGRMIGRVYARIRRGMVTKTSSATAKETLAASLVED